MMALGDQELGTQFPSPKIFLGGVRPRFGGPEVRG